MKLAKREQILVLLLVNLCILVLGFQLVVRPLVAEWRSSSAQLSLLKETRQALQREISGRAQMEADIVARQAVLQEQTQAFFPSGQPEIVHVYLNGLAEENGLTLTEIAFTGQDAELPAGFDKLHVSLRLSGSTEGIFGFIRQMEEMGKVAVVDSFSLQPGGNGLALEIAYNLYCAQIPADTVLEAGPTTGSGLLFEE